MLKLMQKELQLAAHPTLYIFMLLGCLVIVPSYPYTMVFMFACMGPYITMLNARENNDSYFTAWLPVKKSDVVSSKALLIVSTQLITLLISIPFAFLSAQINAGNPVGMNASFAYYGIGLTCFGLFNYLFLTGFYQTAYYIGRPFFKAIIPAFLICMVGEASAHIPQTNWLSSLEMTQLLKQLPVLIVGLLLYGLLSLLAVRKAKDNFQKVDL